MNDILSLIIGPSTVKRDEISPIPPEVETPFEEICVVAGELLEFEVVLLKTIHEIDEYEYLEFELDKLKR